jgi:hypothetical protein
VRELTPSQKGTAAEAAIAAAAMPLGLVVLRPLCEGGGYDLMLDLDPQLLRVQCEWAKHLDGALSVTLNTSRPTPAGYVRTTYTTDQVDAIGVYSAELGRCFLIPIAEVAGSRAIHLRVDPSRNNQAQGIRWDRDYDLEAVIARRQSGRA